MISGAKHRETNLISKVFRIEHKVANCITQVTLKKKKNSLDFVLSYHIASVNPSTRARDKFYWILLCWNKISNTCVTDSRMLITDAAGYVGPHVLARRCYKQENMR